MIRTKNSSALRMVNPFTLLTTSIEVLFYYEAFKPEEKKMISHLKFEQVTASYW